MIEEFEIGKKYRFKSTFLHESEVLTWHGEKGETVTYQGAVFGRIRFKKGSRVVSMPKKKARKVLEPIGDS